MGGLGRVFVGLGDESLLTQVALAAEVQVAVWARAAARAARAFSPSARVFSTMACWFRTAAREDSSWPLA